MAMVCVHHTRNDTVFLVMHLYSVCGELGFALSGRTAVWGQHP